MVGGPHSGERKASADLSTHLHRAAVRSLEADRDYVTRTLHELGGRPERTKHLTAYLLRHLQSICGLSVNLEVRLENYRRENSKRGGIIDMRAYQPQINGYPNGAYILDIEIDNADKANSLRKLIHSQEVLGITLCGSGTVASASAVPLQRKLPNMASQ